MSVTDGATTSGIDGVLTRGRAREGNGDCGRRRRAPAEHLCGHRGQRPQRDHADPADGTYDLVSPPGTWLVGFFDCSNSHYITEFWNHTLRSSNATKLTLTIGTTTTGIDAALSQGASLTGTVTDAGSSSPHPEHLCERDRRRSGGQQPETDANGAYQIDGLPAGAYDVSFVDCNTTPTHGGAVRHDVAVTVAGPNPLDVALADERDRVDRGTDHDQLGRLHSRARAPPRSPGGGNPHFTTPTGPDGTYRFDGLGPGQYYVGFFGCDTNDPLRPIPDPAHPGATYTPQWFSNAPLGTNPDPYGDGATPVTVAGGAVTTVNECLDACNRTVTITRVTPGDGRITVAFTATVNGQSVRRAVGRRCADRERVGHRRRRRRDVRLHRELHRPRTAARPGRRPARRITPCRVGTHERPHLHLHGDDDRRPDRVLVRGLRRGRGRRDRSRLRDRPAHSACRERHAPLHRIEPDRPADGRRARIAPDRHQRAHGRAPPIARAQAARVTTRRPRRGSCRRTAASRAARSSGRGRGSSSDRSPSSSSRSAGTSQLTSNSMPSGSCA